MPVLEANVKMSKYTNQHNEPTCSLNVERREYCRFLLTRFGQSFFCSACSSEDLENNVPVHYQNGWIRPRKGCPFWPEKELDNKDKHD